MLTGPIFTVSTRVSSYQAQSKTSFHLTSRLTCPLALSSRAWHLPFRPETECAVFRVAGGKNHFEHGRQPFRFAGMRLVQRAVSYTHIRTHTQAANEAGSSPIATACEPTP